MTTGEYEYDGIRFQYPENWKLVDQTAEFQKIAVTLDSPTGGFWTLQSFGDDALPRGAADQALEAMRGEYEQFESEPIVEERNGIELIGHNLHFYCLDLLVQSQLRGMHIDGATYLLQYQAEDRDFEGLEPVFGAITHTLLESLRGALPSRHSSHADKTTTDQKKGS